MRARRSSPARGRFCQRWRAAPIGPIGEADIEPLIVAYSTGRKAGNFDLGIQYAVRTLLADPRFLLRIEREPTSVARDGLEPVNDLELASRLSFFIWSSVPDDELLNLAIRGTLSQPKVFEQQVRRLLADRRSIRSFLRITQLAELARQPCALQQEVEMRLELLHAGFAGEGQLTISVQVAALGDLIRQEP